MNIKRKESFGLTNNEEDLVGLFAQLKTNTITEHITLKFEEEGKHFGENLIKCGLEDALRRNKTLKSLTLQGDLVDDKEAGEIIRSLEGNITLTHLYFNGNIRIGEGRAQHLSLALAKNKTLVGIFLDECKINHFGVENICTSFGDGKNRLLSTLSLSGNPVGHAGAQCIYDCAIRGHFPPILHLANTRLDDYAAHEMALAVKTDKFQWIDLSRNNFTHHKAEDFLKILGNNEKKRHIKNLVFLGLETGESKGESKMRYIQAKIIEELEKNREFVSWFSKKMEDRGTEEFQRENYIATSIFFGKARNLLGLLVVNTKTTVEIDTLDEKQKHISDILKKRKSDSDEAKAHHYYSMGENEMDNYKKYYFFERALACNPSSALRSAIQEKEIGLLHQNQFINTESLERFSQQKKPEQEKKPEQAKNNAPKSHKSGETLEGYVKCPPL